MSSEVDLVGAFRTELGWMAFAADERVLLRLASGHRTRRLAVESLGLTGAHVVEASQLWPELADRLTAYAAGEPDPLDGIELSLEHLSRFERRVVERCRQIPYGQTVTYGRLAALAGSARAARAVGNVMASNRFPLVVPCHRVVAAGGKLGHYSGPDGPRQKLRLLEREGSWRGRKARRGVNIGRGGKLA